MRTPGQLQQNYPRELAISEAAALAGIDAIEFRLRQTDDQRLIGVLKAVREASGWQTRPSPGPKAQRDRLRAGVGPGRLGDAALGNLLGLRLPGVGRPEHGQGDAWTSTRSPSIRGSSSTRCSSSGTIEGGALMGLSHALYEEMTFDESGVTSRDWRSYPILTMADVPEIKVVILNHPEVGAYGGGSEAANALACRRLPPRFSTRPVSRRAGCR